MSPTCSGSIYDREKCSDVSSIVVNLVVDRKCYSISYCRRSSDSLSKKIRGITPRNMLLLHDAESLTVSGSIMSDVS